MKIGRSNLIYPADDFRIQSPDQNHQMRKQKTSHSESSIQPSPSTDRDRYVISYSSAIGSLSLPLSFSLSALNGNDLDSTRNFRRKCVLNFNVQIESKRDGLGHRQNCANDINPSLGSPFNPSSIFQQVQYIHRTLFIFIFLHVNLAKR